MKLFDLSEKIALVTGGTRGIGKGIALGLAEAGADVAIVARTMREDTLAAIRAKGVRAWGIAFDLARHQHIDDLVRTVLDQTGRVDILVNNAGLILRHPLDHFTAEDWHAVLDLNLTSTFFVCQKFGLRMVEQGGGKIINIGSLLSVQGGINVPSYAASKGGVLQITKAMANEWASHNVNVNCILPGYIRTELTEALMNDMERCRQLFERIPQHRFGETEDLAGAAVFLASSASDYVNGIGLPVDGGWLAR
ncbi:MAG: glucose 1-dehydrogenase [Deltaproteobacteria bacterium]|jgi:2-deoxy-D-gluconate 3-dehydrogenase|nr:glucose 1-dehydrogenase [Deltaproteobacteria bacterium]